MGSPYPLGKLPPDVLASLLYNNPIRDPRVIVGPRPGEDAAILDAGGSHFLVAKTDPITFATDEIGWYAVHVNANDIATTGGAPAWFMATILLPEQTANWAMVDGIFTQLRSACDELEVSLVGGHTEITYGIDRPIITGVMLGLVEKDKLVLTSGAQPGDSILVTKGAPIEATAIIARERRAALEASFPPELIQRCAGYLHAPGISVVRDARIAAQAGRVHAMHDPTEGGLATGLWEMAEASSKRLLVNPQLAVLPDSRAICEAVGLDPLGAIASGALLLAAHPDDTPAIEAALRAAGIAAYRIGAVEAGPPEVIDLHRDSRVLQKPARDEIAQLFE